MKVLHIITDFDNGGAQAVLYRFVAANPQNDHHVISLMTIGSYGDRLIKLGIKVDAIHLPGKKVTIAGLTKLYRLIKQIDPAVIQTWMYQIGRAHV